MYPLAGGVLGYTAVNLIKPEAKATKRTLGLFGISGGLGAANYELQELYKTDKQRLDDITENIEEINRRFASKL